MFILAKVSEESVLKAIHLLTPWCDGEPILLGEQAPPSRYVPPIVPKPDNEQENLALRIAQAIRPRDSQKHRREMLRVALGKLHPIDGSFGFTLGDDTTLRNGLVALSKALRPFAPNVASPIAILADREKSYNDGVYLATFYKPTPLGLRVREILESWNEI